MAEQPSSEVRKWLAHCGLSERRLARCTGKTRLYHDLGIYGEIAEGFMEELGTVCHVDFTGFELDNFFPPEFEGKNTLVAGLFYVLPFASHLVRKRREYAPLTLEMMELVIQSKHWRTVALRG